MAGEAGYEQSNAKDATQEKRAEAAWKRAEAYRQQAVEMAKLSGDSSDLIAASEMQDELDNRRIRALRSQVELQEELADEAEERSHQAEEHNAELEEMRRAIEGKLKLTTKDETNGARFKTKDEVKQDLASTETLIKEFKAKLTQYGGEDFAKSFLSDPRAFESIQREAERSLASYNIEKIEATPDSLSHLYDSIKDQTRQMEIEIPVIADIARVTGMDVASVGVQKMFDELERQMNEGFNSELRRLGAYRKLAGAKNEYDDARAGRVPQGSEALRETVAEMDRLHNSTSITEADLIGLTKLLPEAGKGLSTEGMQVLMTMRDAIQAQKAAQDQLHGISEAQGNSQLDHIKAVIEGIKAKKAATDEETSSLNRNIQSVQNLANLWQSVFGTAPNGETPRTACWGGSMYRADGGEAHGTDTIPAMLSPGEMVINAASSKRFASQLIAMNAGITPAFRSEGGSVTNIGDINVSVTGGDSARQSARSIATELRRELRRGVSVL